MTIAQAIQKWHVSKSSIRRWCNAGVIPGARQEPLFGSVLTWIIPDDAQPPDKASRSGIQSAAALPDPVTMEQHIMRYAKVRTYAQLSRDLGIPTPAIRDIYDRLHAKYGV